MRLCAISPEMVRSMVAKFCMQTHAVCVQDMSIGVIVTIYFPQIQHHIHLTEGKQNTKLAECHIPYTVPRGNLCH